jgi:uncharacterized protein (TIGR02145 family)
MLNFLFNDELGLLQRFYNNRSMKNLVNVLVFSLGIGVVHAQSKKEMIVLLNSRVDSLNQVVANERSVNTRLTTKIGQLEAVIKRLENEKSALDVNLEAQRKLKDAQIKSKQDSLALVVNELLQYKPAPPKVEEKLIVAQDVSGPIKTVTIGKQVWMLENLNVATFKNGVAIPEVKDEDAWVNAERNQQAAWCYYDNDPKNGEKYGKLYNWYAVDDNNGLCPQGWHVPSDGEWDTLVKYLGGEDVAGAKMKTKSIIKKTIQYYDTGGYDETIWKSCTNCSHWTEKQKENFPCNVCKNTRGIFVKTGKFIPKSREKTEHIETIGGWYGTNESGFTGLPGGLRNTNGNYYYVGSSGYWWSSTESSTDYAWDRVLNGSDGNANRGYSGKKDGSSVRCLRD